jgi:hypothetical protein
MKLFNICMSAAVVGLASGQRGKKNKGKNNYKKPKATKPSMINVPTQVEPGFEDNRQEIANMLAFRLAFFGYDHVEFTDVLR